MHSPYGMELVEDCLSCKLCSAGFFCHLPKSVIEAFQPLKFTIAYPAGATLFVEGQASRGIYILCKGRVKLSATSREGQTLILQVAQPGEVLGLNATVSGSPHDTTAETGQPCQLNFVKRDDFLKFLTEHGLAGMHAAIQLSRESQHARIQCSGWRCINFALTGPTATNCALSRQHNGFTRYKAGQECSLQQVIVVALAGVFSACPCSSACPGGTSTSCTNTWKTVHFLPEILLWHVFDYSEICACGVNLLLSQSEQFSGPRDL